MDLFKEFQILGIVYILNYKLCSIHHFQLKNILKII